ncbi:hypothetical protein FOZ63_000066 [Perkinsus olseni]|uniref:Integrase catalytic domain-containing protein n=1 Tax=Perkinsus olseni TaxID=32597 RepID=A0A7J6UGZ5_PEROL|nr:hypothetical protein FOZ63_000066 [Perkinsus olseni]
MKAMRFHFVPGESNPADALTRNPLAEKTIAAMSPKNSIRRGQQQQVCEAQGNSTDKLMVLNSTEEPQTMIPLLAVRPDILGRGIVASHLSDLFRLSKAIRAWRSVAGGIGRSDELNLEDGGFQVSIQNGLRQWICEKQIPLHIDPSDNRFLKIGPLWYQVTLFSPSGELLPQLLLPNSADMNGILRSLVWRVHEATAHACPAMVFGLLQNYCTWQKQRRFVHDVLKTCDYCQRVARDRIRDYCGVRKIQTIPWYRVGLDVYGPVYKASRYDKSGRAPFNYVLTYTCYYTSKTVLRPLRHCSGNEIAGVHREVVADFGLMPYLSVDCGSEFMSEEFLAVTVEQGTQVCYDSPNSPWSRAPLERRHAILSKLFRVLALARSTGEWQMHLSKATRAINNATLLPGDPTLTPDTLFFAYRPQSDLSLWFAPDQDRGRRVDLDRQLQLRCVYDAQWMKNREADRLTVDRRGHVPRPVPTKGDEVLVWVDTTGDKFKYCWRGPYTVVDVNAKGQLLLEGLKRPQAPSNVKVYHRPEKTVENTVNEKKYGRLDDIAEGDFVVYDKKIYQVVTVNREESWFSAANVLIEGEDFNVSDETRDFDIALSDAVLVPGIRVSNVLFFEEGACQLLRS